jgi:kanamycin kinase
VPGTTDNLERAAAMSPVVRRRCVRHDRPVIGHRPAPDVPLPAAVRALTSGDVVVPVWRNELGGLTVEAGTGSRRRFVKWAPPGVDPGPEAARLDWAAASRPVPRVLAVGADDEGSWLVTAALPGHNAIEDPDPARAVAATGRGCARATRRCR